MSKAVAQTILNQLGGNKFLAMTGAHTLVCDSTWLRMTLRRNQAGAKWLKIELRGDDTYTMIFSKMKKTLNKEKSIIFPKGSGMPSFKVYDEELIEVKKYEGVYWDQLQELFTDVTGYDTHL